MLGLLVRPTQLSKFKTETPCAEQVKREEALKITALAASLLFVHGDTTERTVVAAERLGHFLGVSAKVLPYWDELIVEVDGAPVCPCQTLAVYLQHEPVYPATLCRDYRGYRGRCCRAFPAIGRDRADRLLSLYGTNPGAAYP